MTQRFLFSTIEMKFTGLGLLLIVLLSGQTIDDFMVNHESYPAHWAKDNVVADRDSAGNVVLAWYDTRLGEGAVYGQRCDRTGVPVDSNFKINDDNLSVIQDRIDLACDKSGKFVVVWNGRHHVYAGREGIYFRVFSEGGAPLDTAKLVACSDYVERPSVDLAGNGDFLVAWREPWATPGILAVRVDSFGQTIGQPFVVSDSMRSPNFPAVVFDESSGCFWIVWGCTEQPYRVFAQRFDARGNRLGTNFVVNDSSYCPLWGCSEKSIAVRDLTGGRYAVAWSSRWGGPPPDQIVARLFRADGTPLGPGFVVSDHLTDYRTAPSIATYGNGNFVISWTDDRESYDWSVPDIYAQRYDSLGCRVDSNFRVNDTTGRIAKVKMDNSAVIGNSDFFVVAWRSRHHWADALSNRILFKVYNRSGNAQGSAGYVSDDRGYAHQYLPSLAVGPGRQFLVAWSDTRVKVENVFGKLYDQGGNVLVPDFLLDRDSIDHRICRAPSVACNDRVFLTTYQKERYDRYVRGQRLDLNGVPVGNNFMIIGGPVMGLCDLATAPSKHFVGTHVIGDDTLCDVYGYRFDSLGLLLGSPFRVNDLPNNAYSPSVGMGPDGRFAICWEVQRWSDSRIYAQCFDAAGAGVGGNFQVDSLLDLCFYPRVAFDRQGNFVVSWVRMDGGNDFNIWARRFDSSRVALGPSFRVNESARPWWDDPGAIVCRNAHEFLVVWAEQLFTSSSLWAQYHANGQAVGRNVSIAQAIVDHQLETPRLASDSERIYVCWTSFRTKYPHNYDVFAKVILWSELTGAGTEVESQIEDTRLRVLPNPGRNCIRFSLPGTPNGKKVTLGIYDASGRLVRRFAHLPGRSGRVFSWDCRDTRANDVASGVYFCELRVGSAITRSKLVIVR